MFQIEGKSSWGNWSNMWFWITTFLVLQAGGPFIHSFMPHPFIWQGPRYCLYKVEQKCPNRKGSSSKPDASKETEKQEMMR